MTRRTYLGGIAALSAAILVSAVLLAQDEPYGEMSAEEQAMMEAFEAYRAIGSEHEQFAARAGEWTLHGKLWHAPGMPPEEFEATSKLKTILGGRYLVEKVHGETMGEEFEGFGLYGYDNLTQTYVGAWVDNFGTGILRTEGTPSGDGKTIHYTVDHPDVMNGKYKKVRAVEEIISDDKSVYTQYQTGPDGQEYKHMELTYTRGAAKKDMKDMKGTKGMKSKKDY